jgi:hypothetical protein
MEWPRRQACGTARLVLYPVKVGLRSRIVLGRTPADRGRDDRRACGARARVPVDHSLAGPLPETVPVFTRSKTKSLERVARGRPRADLEEAISRRAREL